MVIVLNKTHGANTIMVAKNIHSHKWEIFGEFVSLYTFFEALYKYHTFISCLMQWFREDLHHLLHFTIKEKKSKRIEISQTKLEKWKQEREFLINHFKHPCIHK